MKKIILFTAFLVGFSVNFAYADEKTVKTLLDTYAAKNSDVNQGRLLWQKEYIQKDNVSSRSCATCHTKDLTALGKHVKTNKSIKPMAPLVNSQRLTSSKKIEKWFKRNCKWTMGRECTSEEKASLLLYINNQTNF